MSRIDVLGFSLVVFSGVLAVIGSVKRPARTIRVLARVVVEA
jgi:hypothetical protein